MARGRTARGLWRWVLGAAVIAGLAALMLFVTGYREALRDPVVRHREMVLPGWPAGEPPVRLVLISDIHVAWPDMPPARVQHIVGQINALKPDVVLIAGDIASGRLLAVHYSKAEVVGALRGLKARHGVFAVYGNHEHRLGPVDFRRELTKLGIRTLVNDAADAGPLVIGGVDDDTSNHAELGQTQQRAQALAKARGGAPIVLFTHNPGIFPWMSEDIPLMLAGHSHCNQIRLPGIHMAALGYLGGASPCGVSWLGRRTLIVTAGLGVGGPLMRFNAPPDLWVVTVGGARAGAIARP